MWNHITKHKNQQKFCTAKGTSRRLPDKAQIIGQNLKNQYPKCISLSVTEKSKEKSQKLNA